MARKPKTIMPPGSRDAELVAIGVDAAGLLRRVRELNNSGLNYFFEMAWHAVYQQCDETTRVALLEAVEADLARELALLRKAG